MQQFTYRIQGDIPMHFGPVGRLASICREYPDTKATIQMGTRVADISCPVKVATMGLRKDDIVTVTCEGDSEVDLLDVLYQHFEALI